MRRRLPSRGDVWLANLNPTRGHEQASTWPCLIVSTDAFNHGPSGLVVILPITTRRRGVPFHISVGAPEGGLSEESFVKCEDIRSVSTERLVRRLGAVSDPLLNQIEDRLRILLQL